MLFGVDAPDLGGFACVMVGCNTCTLLTPQTVATGSAWKIGQARPGDTIRFVGISITEARAIEEKNDEWLSSLLTSPVVPPLASSKFSSHLPSTAVLYRVAGTPERVFRQAGDRFVMYEVGLMALDLRDRVRVELWERAMRVVNVGGMINFNSSVRGCLVHFDPLIIARDHLVQLMIEVDKNLEGVERSVFDIQVLRLPAVPDDTICQDAVSFYMKAVRDKAVYLPNNMVRL